MARAQFDGVKVFSATVASEREALGERVTQWLRAHPEVELVDRAVRQSSDERHHCVTIVLFYATRGDGGGVVPSG